MLSADSLPPVPNPNTATISTSDDSAADGANEETTTTTNSYTNDDIGTGRALSALVGYYADACVIADATEVHEGEWRVTLDYGGRQIPVTVTRRERPTARQAISTLWAHTDACASQWQSLYHYVRKSHPEWLDETTQCKRVFGDEFGVSPTLPADTVFMGDHGEPVRVVSVQVKTDYGLEWTTAYTPA